MRNYLEEKGIASHINDYSIRNNGEKPLNPKDYSCDPDYESVDPAVFEYLDNLDIMILLREVKEE